MSRKIIEAVLCLKDAIREAVGSDKNGFQIHVDRDLHEYLEDEIRKNLVFNPARVRAPNECIYIAGVKIKQMEKEVQSGMDFGFNDRNDKIVWKIFWNDSETKIKDDKMKKETVKPKFNIGDVVEVFKSWKCENIGEVFEINLIKKSSTTGTMIYSKGESYQVYDEEQLKLHTPKKKVTLYKHTIAYSIVPPIHSTIDFLQNAVKETTWTSLGAEEYKLKHGNRFHRIHKILKTETKEVEIDQ